MVKVGKNKMQSGESMNLSSLKVSLMRARFKKVLGGFDCGSYRILKKRVSLASVFRVGKN